MPLSGIRDIAPLLGDAPLADRLATEEVVLPGVEVLHVLYEIDDRTMVELLPPALHPTIPPTVSFVVWRVPESPAGAFTLAQVRVGCRAGMLPRGFLLASYCDTADAAAWLRSGYGFDCRPGIVRLRRNYDRVAGSVVVADETVLSILLNDPQAISGADVMYISNVNLARVPGDDGERPRLVQVDPEYTFRRAERGQPRLETFVQSAWNAEGVEPNYPVAATACTVDLTMPRIRYILDPAVTAMQGTEKVGG